MNKILRTAAVAATLVGASAFAAPSALASDHEGDGPWADGNAAKTAYGNTMTGGRMSPNMALVNGSLNDVCVAAPDVAENVKNIVGLVNVGLDDILNQEQNQTCAKNSSARQGDAPLSHLLDDFPIISGNGAGNHNP